MHKGLRVIGIGLISAQVLLGGAVQPAAEPRSAPAVAPVKGTEAASEAERFVKRLEAVDAAMAKVADLRADFEQRRHTPLLKKPLISKGTVLTKGEQVRWETATPRASSLQIGDGLIRLFYPSDNLVEEYPAGEGFKDLAGAPLPRLSVLRERFDISQITPADLGVSEKNSKLLAIRLAPKSEALKSHVTSVKVLIDESQPAAIKVVMTDPEGEETEIFFSNVKLNQGVKDDEIELKMPRDVRVSRPLGEGKSGPKDDGGNAAQKPALGGGRP